MEEKKQEKWYFKPGTLIISFLCVGPFMLPLVWMNPNISRRSKAVISGVVIVLTLILTVVMVKSLQSIGKYYEFILAN